MSLFLWSRMCPHDLNLLPTVSRCRYLFSNSGKDSTIYSLSSGHGKCGVAVIRVSGPRASEALLSLGRYKELPKPRVATVRKLFNPRTGDPLDHGLSIWFPGPRSFTGEDCVEFHVHGGTAVVMSVLNSLATLPGLRHAEPGDFTKRALFNGKLDLTEVEGLSDLIHAETESQRIQALRQMKGDLSRLYNTWSEKLLKCLAHVEATIDFGEEENIEEGLVPEVCDKVMKLIKEMDVHLIDGRRGERLRTGIQVAIVGAPNAGKSSLLNILCQRPAAIVSPYAGTTRDIVESSLDVFGYPIVLSDTAGLRLTTDPVECEGIERALNKAETADLTLLIIDTSLNKELLLSQYHMSNCWSLLLETLMSTLNIDNKDRIEGKLNAQNTIIIMNKIDLLDDNFSGLISKEEEGSPLSCWISCTTGEGLEHFFTILKRKLNDLGGDPLSGSPQLTQTRHRHHIEECKESLNNFIDHCCCSEESDLVLGAEELRQAMTAIGRITGRIGIEDVLDVIFKDFCIGK